MIRLTLDIEGLCLCHFNDDRLRIGMLNSESEPTLEIPEHLPTLVLPKAGVDEAASVNFDRFRVPLANRVRADLTDGDYWGWDLSSVELSIGAGRAPTKPRPGSSDIHPKTEPPNWSDMRWVLDIGRFTLGAVLRADVLEIGRESRAVAVLKGGSVEGAPPQRGNELCDWVWDLTPRYQQAMTDSLRYTYSSAAISLHLRQGPDTAELKLNTSCLGHLINEATPLDIAAERTKPSASVIARHARSYYERFEYLGGRMPPAPRKSHRFRNHGSVDGVFCIVMTVGAI